jgi:hypothetical protein
MEYGRITDRVDDSLENSGLTKLRMLLMRVLFALLIAPLFPGLVLLIASKMIGATGEGWIFSFSTLVAYSLAVVLGVPVYFFLKQQSFTGLGSYFIAGAIISMVPIVYFVVFPGVNNSGSEGLVFSWSHLMQILVILLASTSATCVFWIIARPDLK